MPKRKSNLSRVTKKAMKMRHIRLKETQEERNSRNLRQNINNKERRREQASEQRVNKLGHDQPQQSGLKTDDLHHPVKIEVTLEQEFNVEAEQRVKKLGQDQPQQSGLKTDDLRHPVKIEGKLEQEFNVQADSAQTSVLKSVERPPRHQRKQSADRIRHMANYIDMTDS